MVNTRRKRNNKQKKNTRKKRRNKQSKRDNRRRKLIMKKMFGGEIYVNKSPSMKVTDIAKAISPKAKQEIIGIRSGEKLHEQMFSKEDSEFTYEYSDYFKILPKIYEKKIKLN